jgi:hypothetical protein
MDELQITLQHDKRVFSDGAAICNEGELRELINYVYSEYQYRAAQIDKLIKLIDYLASEKNRYINPALTDQNAKLSVYLENFRDFLKTNFHPGEQTEDGDTIYFFQVQENSSENEAFLAEFQLLSMDVEKAYRNYRAAVISQLQIKPL